MRDVAVGHGEVAYVPEPQISTELTDVRGAEKGLRPSARAQCAKKLTTPVHVQFAQHVVEDKHRGRSRRGRELTNLGELQRENDGSLLTLRTRRPSRSPVEHDFHVVPMRAGDGYPADAFLLPACREFAHQALGLDLGTLGVGASDVVNAGAFDICVAPNVAEV